MSMGRVDRPPRTREEDEAIYGDKRPAGGCLEDEDEDCPICGESNKMGPAVHRVCVPRAAA